MEFANFDIHCWKFLGYGIALLSIKLLHWNFGIWKQVELASEYLCPILHYIITRGQHAIKSKGTYMRPTPLGITG